MVKKIIKWLKGFKLKPWVKGDKKGVKLTKEI